MTLIHEIGRQFGVSNNTYTPVTIAIQRERTIVVDPPMIKVSFTTPIVVSANEDIFDRYDHLLFSLFEQLVNI